jgi:hypothetical protein
MSTSTGAGAGAAAAAAAPRAGAAMLVAILGHLIGADVASCDRASLDGLVDRSQRLRNWLDAFDVRVATRASQLADQGSSESPGDVLRNRGRRSGKDAEQAAQRSRACGVVPGLEDALADGRVSGGHVDALANCAAGLDESGTEKLTELADDIVSSAAALPVEQFERECRDLARILSARGGESRQQRNRRDRKVRRWVDRQSGMCKTLIELDAEADARMWTAINAAVAATRNDRQPDDDRTHDQIQADTVVDLITGSQAADPRVPEVSVMIDSDTLRDDMHETTVCETSNGEPVDVDTVRRFGCDGDLVGILLDGDGHVLNVGRARRLATRAQRQALRAMYGTCAFPCCDVDFDRCRVHHVDWWEHGGRTDLDRLVPVCSIHHHLIHEAGWQLTLDPDRTITLHRPDGSFHFQGDTTDRAAVRADQPATATTRQRSNGETVTDVSDLAEQLANALETVLADAGERPPP